MFDANLKIIEELKQFLSMIKENSEVLQKFSVQPKAFTRNRKLTFERLVLLISKLCKKTLSVEIENFFEELHVELTCSTSAFTQQRMKLNPLLFKAWNDLLTMSYYYHHGPSIKRWHDYRLVAADGSNISLVNTAALQTYFGGQRNQQCSFVQAKTFYCYDVLNELILHAQISPYRTGEIPMAYAITEKLEKDMLMIYDRNFSNFKMLALHLWHPKKIKFLIRAKESLLYVRSFIQSGKQSDIITLPATPSAIIQLAKNGYKIEKDTALKVRLVRVDLPESTEVLITNLWEEEGYLSSEFKELYFKRWGVETNIALQKNILQLESFSGLTPLSVEQDFFATIFIANLHSILIKDAQQTINEKSSMRKYPMRVNKNKSYGRLRKSLVSLFDCNEPKIILEKLHNYFIREPVPIRTGRSFPRVIKNKQSKSKHKTFTNYKPAF